MKNIMFIWAGLLFSIGIALFAQTPAEADAMARDAVRRLEAALSGNAVAPVGSQNTPVPQAQVSRGGRQPNWVNDPYNAYSRNYFIAAVGSAASRDQAEARAFAALAAIFGQSIKSEFTTATMYTEAVNRGVVNVSNVTDIREQISIAASMDKLIGAQIGNVWDSRRGTVYAVAFMDKAKTISIYSDLILINNRNIELLTSMSNAQKNTFDGYARFKLAAEIAGINDNYAAVVSYAGGSITSLNLKSPDSFNLEAAEIIRNITVTVRVTNDRANRIQDAFAGVLSSQGLRTRGNNPLYTLDVRLNESEVTFPGNNHVFCRIEVSANLIENATGVSLFPFSFNERAGHSTYANAQTAAFAGAEKIIMDRYSAALRDYLTSLIPIN